MKNEKRLFFTTVLKYICPIQYDKDNAHEKTNIDRAAFPDRINSRE
jgi:hypothetical protein